jgi:hypothetical protein
MVVGRGVECEMKMGSFRVELQSVSNACELISLRLVKQRTEITYLVIRE